MTTRRENIHLQLAPSAKRGVEHLDPSTSRFALEASGSACEHESSRQRSPEQPFWRSLDELAGSPEFEEYLHREFPDNASEWTDPVGRRQFLKLMAASLSLAGLASCTRQPTEKIVPYVHPPEQIVAGKPLFYATAMPVGGVGQPVLAKSHMGRPIKIEGNEQHPASLGASDALAQASVLTLYDPDRSRTILNLGQVSTWAEFVAALNLELEAQRGLATKGAGLRLLTPPVTSPTLAAQIQAMLAAFPGAKWHQYDPAGSDNVLAGARMAFGEAVQPVYHFDKADVILALDGDFLCSGHGALRYARDFAARRRVYENAGRMNRLYAVESAATNTGAAADHRLRLCPQDVEEFAHALARGLGVEPFDSTVMPVEKHQAWVSAVVNDLKAHRGASLIIAGDAQPPVVHALAHTMNEALGNVGQTVTYIQPLPAVPIDGTDSLADLAKDIAAGAVNMLVIAGCNPVYDAPADLGFGELLADVKSKLRFRVHLGLYNDETAQYCHWHIPAAHYLESWGDVRAFDGTATILQPLIAPLYGGKSELELIAAILGASDRTGYDLVRDYWKAGKLSNAQDFERSWQTALHDGLIAGTAFEARPVKARPLPLRQPGVLPSPAGLTLIFRPDPSLRDGQFANNAWLQELPDSLTKLTWDNAALLSPATAKRLDLANEDQIELKYNGRSVTAPVWIAPGQADECVVVNLGYGRRRAGQVGTGVGFDAYALRTSKAPWFDAGLEIRKTGRSGRLACTQQHHSLEGRQIVRQADLDEYTKHPDFAQHLVENPAADMTLYPQPKPKDAQHAWGMAIDLNSCIGCNACVVACQAENNIPVVGKEQVRGGREMHWLRIDRYFQGEKPDDPRTYLQPMACTHCEYAPCEVVCPVGATVHSSEGLNEMVYNRCVGTRYCSNNCPYKVRRFNFLQYNDLETPVLKLLRNPDVSVRARGVMEKCTYCVQRINAARIEAEKENRPLRDGEIVTACQGACPTRAIVFGDLNDTDSRVSRLKREPLNYGVLEEINTRPRTTHLAKVWNPNPELME